MEHLCAFGERGRRDRVFDGVHEVVVFLIHHDAVSVPLRCAQDDNDKKKDKLCVVENRIKNAHANKNTSKGAR